MPEYSVATWEIVDAYNKQYPDHALNTLNLHPDLKEDILLRCLREALMNTIPISYDDYRVYSNEKP